MLFNSLDFALFLPLVFLGYWFIFNKNLTLQNLFVVFASYVFYGWWDYRFLALIIFSSLADYFIGKEIFKTEGIGKRKVLLWASITINIGLLGFFKYFNFFVDSLEYAFSFFGAPISGPSLNIILPVGISFYTFQTLSYTIDIYKKKLLPTTSIISFLAFVSFFPQLVAGPIERASNLLPQFLLKRKFKYDQSVDGLRQMLWGFFKKIVIADNCAEFVNIVFNSPENLSGSTLLFGAILFAFQIYGDFSGYSDIAIGTSRLFGFNLMQNFRFPYFSRDIAEFWRRWHISLSTWFRDYLYIPLGGSRGGKLQKIRNTFIIFVVSGFWHGANWTFIFWGLLHALLFIPLLISNRNRNNLDDPNFKGFFNSIKEMVFIGATFFMTTLAWILFRSESIVQSIKIYKGIFSKSLFASINGGVFIGTSIHPLVMIILVLVFIMLEWIGKHNKYAFEYVWGVKNRVIRFSVYSILIVSVFWFLGKPQEFIYFQF